jgi:hypothetical protein
VGREAQGLKARREEDWRTRTKPGIVTVRGTVS